MFLNLKPLYSFTGFVLKIFISISKYINSIICTKTIFFLFTNEIYIFTWKKILSLKVPLDIIFFSVCLIIIVKQTNDNRHSEGTLKILHFIIFFNTILAQMDFHKNKVTIQTVHTNKSTFFRSYLLCARESGKTTFHTFLCICKLLKLLCLPF